MYIEAMNIDPESNLPPQAAAIADFTLDAWTVHPSLNRISREDASENLEPRMMHVLVCLAAVPGQVIGRQKLLEHVWCDAVVGEEALTRAISRLRILLGDDSHESRFIETIRGVGYRLLVKPELAGKPEISSAPIAARDKRRLLWPMLLTAVVVISLWALFNQPSGPENDSPLVASALPFTTYPGHESFPDFSPDGVTVAFSRAGKDGLTAGLFLKQQDVDEARRLTTTSGLDYSPRFSPDGRQIAFVRREGSSRAILLVPALGGATRKLLDVDDAVFGLSWSADGAQLAFASLDPRDRVSRIMQIDRETLTYTALTQPDLATHSGDSWPSFSPDGQWLAFARCDHAGLRDIWLASAGGGSEKELTSGLNNVLGIEWLPGGTHLLTAAAPEGKMGLWLVELAEGRFWQLPNTARGGISQPAVSPDGSLVIFRSQVLDYNIMQVHPEEDHPARQLAPFSVSTRNEINPIWSPDGSQLAFISDRSGSQELWLVRADATGLRKLTDYPRADFLRPHWSPDGSHLAVTMTDPRRSQVLVVEVATGLTRPLSDDSRHERACGWTNDGSGFNVLWDTGSDWTLGVVSENGTLGTPRFLTLSGHPDLRTAADGIWFVHPESGGLWLASPDGSTWEPVLTQTQMQGVRDWQQVDKGIILLRATADDATEVVRVDLPNLTETTLASVPSNTAQVAVNPVDGRILITVLERIETDLMQIRLEDLNLP